MHLFLLILIALICVAAEAKAPLTISLDEAIYLAIREHPNVQNAQLNQVLQKFNLEVQKWQFKPHYTFKATAMAGKIVSSGVINGSHSWDVQPEVSWLSPIGTQVLLSATNTVTSNYNPGLSAQIIQPLMRGFGKAVVEAMLYDAIDSDTIAKLSIENVLRTTVTAVISSYLNVVLAERQISIDEQAVARARQSVLQTKQFIKAGHKAGNELVTVEANVASAEAQLENDKNNLNQARYALLTAIGIDPNTPIHLTHLDLGKLIKKYQLPRLDQVQQLILANDIQYQIDQITLNGSTKRSLLLAKDNRRWDLNVSINAETGRADQDGKNAGINSLFNGLNQARTVILNLDIPINDKVREQAEVTAKISLQQAEIGLQQEKWAKETSAINGWNTVVSAERALRFAENAEQLQDKTYHISYQKYIHGLIDSLSLQTAQLQLISAQQSLLNARIGYLNALVNLDLLIGNTLKTWDVKVRLS